MSGSIPLSPISDQDFAGLILMGGQSTRMGQDKAFVKWKGQTLLEHALNLLRPITPDIYLSVNQEQFNKLNTSFSCIEDKYPQKGPLGGILSGLESLQKSLLVIGIDMPNVDAATLNKILEQQRAAEDVIAYRDGQRWHPLPSFWSVNLIEDLKTTISSKDVSLQGVLDKHAKALDVTLDGTIVLNINSPGNLE